MNLELCPRSPQCFAAPFYSMWTHTFVTFLPENWNKGLGMSTWFQLRQQHINLFNQVVHEKIIEKRNLRTRNSRHNLASGYIDVFVFLYAGCGFWIWTCEDMLDLHRLKSKIHNLSLLYFVQLSWALHCQHLTAYVKHYFAALAFD